MDHSSFDTTQLELLDRIHKHADCIILPGGKCDINGSPTGDLKLRCDYESWLKAYGITNYKYTILTGGARGVAAHSVQDPTATEARQMKQYCVHNGQPIEHYIEESFALDTLGNLVFSTKELLKRELKRPVFMTQYGHAHQLDLAADHWYGNSGIRPLFWIVDDSIVDPSKGPPSQKRLGDGVRDSLLSRGTETSRGFGFVSRSFLKGTLGLPSPDWDNKDWDNKHTKWVFEVAIRWLFNFYEGPSKYRDVYTDVEGFLDRFLI
jgi:DUF218 domain-containing protein